MGVDDSLERLIESLTQLLEEGRSVRLSLDDLRRSEEGSEVENSRQVEATFEVLAKSVSTTLEDLHDRLRRLNDVLREMRGESSG